MYLIVGLGNPGKEYENTRHNIGFRVLEEVAPRVGVGELKYKLKCMALVADGKLKDHKLILAEPQTFMNLSGEAVDALLRWYKISADHLIVLYDDVDVDLGQIRVKLGGSSAGHHGIESIMNKIKTAEFIRVRVGIGRSDLLGDVTDYVLEEIPLSQKSVLDKAILNAVDATLSIVTEGMETAKAKFNRMRAS